MSENMNNEKIAASMAAENEIKGRNPQKRREIIKTLLIIFLVIMLLLLFFSNTIMNKSLAEISTESVSSGRLTERIRGSGMVEANQLYEVKIDGNRIIDTICVKKGQEVKAGDVLFTAGASESAELAEAQAQLDAMELEYQKSLLVVPEDFASENQAIKNAQEDYNAAVEKMEAAVSGEARSKAELSKYNKNKTQLAQKTALHTEISAVLSAVDADDYSSVPAGYTGNLVSLLKAYKAAESAYSEAYELYKSIASVGGDASSAEKKADEKEKAMNSAKQSYDKEKKQIRESLTAQFSSLKSEINALNSAISAYESSMTEMGGMSAAELQADVTTKQRVLEDLLISLERAKMESDMANQTANLDIEAKKSEIDKLKAKIEALEQKCGIIEIISEYDGIISSVNVKPGEMTIPDVAAATIDISSMGYRVQIVVDGNQASKVESGAVAEVVNNWNKDIKAVLSDIRNDTTSGSKNRILIFDITGDVDTGSYIDLSIPCGSGNYDTIVPKSAVYEDAKGKFVLTVKPKSSPLGNRYYTERIDVEVLSSDEISSAVSGSLGMGDYVITAASKPVAPGEQVRMKD